MRWTQHLQDPDFKKGRWSPEEDVTLKAAHAKLGDKFPENAALVPGRDDGQDRNCCHNRSRGDLKFYVAFDRLSGTSESDLDRTDREVPRSQCPAAVVAGVSEKGTLGTIHDWLWAVSTCSFVIIAVLLFLFGEDPDEKRRRRAGETTAGDASSAFSTFPS